MRRFACVAVVALALVALNASPSQAWWWNRPVVVAPAYPAYYGAYYAPPVYPVTRASYYYPGYVAPAPVYAPPVYSYYSAPWYSSYPAPVYSSYYYPGGYGLYYR